MALTGYQLLVIRYHFFTILSLVLVLEGDVKLLAVYIDIHKVNATSTIVIVDLQVHAQALNPLYASAKLL